MIDWVQAGIRQPRQAWFWNCLHFTPESAAPWIRQGFTPPLAREWLDHEYTAEEAIEHIRLGLTDPRTAKEEGKKIITE